MAVRFGVVGTAYWADEVHAPGLQAVDGVELVGFHGRSPANAEAAARRNGVRAFATFAEMLDAVDAVSIALSPDAQPTYALQAARAGKHLLLEKPLALELEAAQAIADAVAAGRVAALVFFARRFIPEVAAAIDAARSHAWTQATVRLHASPLAEDSPYRNSIWRQAEGAALWDIGPHALSVVLPIMGPVVEAHSLPAEPDHVRFALRHADGGQSDISLTLRAAPDRKVSLHEFAGPAGTVFLPDPAYDRPATLTAAAEQLVRLIRTGDRSHACGVELGLETTRILAGVEQQSNSRASSAASDKGNA